MDSDAPTELPFGTDYAKSNRASCAVCKDKIDKVGVFVGNCYIVYLNLGRVKDVDPSAGWFLGVFWIG